MVRVLSLASALVLLAVTPAALRSFAEGPFPGFTGGFKEPTCEQCHFGRQLNERGGSITVSGVPAAYRPGEAYTITVTIEKAGLQKAGFQLAARFASGAAAGRDGGALATLDGATQLVQSADRTVTYVQHTRAGTQTTTAGRFTWKLRWIAPPSDAEPVEFDLAANASNADDSPLGDAIYTTRAISKSKHDARAVKARPTKSLTPNAHDFITAP